MQPLDGLPADLLVRVRHDQRLFSRQGRKKARQYEHVPMAMVSGEEGVHRGNERDESGRGRERERGRTDDAVEMCSTHIDVSHRNNRASRSTTTQLGARRRDEHAQANNEKNTQKKTQPISGG